MYKVIILGLFASCQMPPPTTEEDNCRIEVDYVQDPDDGRNFYWEVTINPQGD